MFSNKPPKKPILKHATSQQALSSKKVSFGENSFESFGLQQSKALRTKKYQAFLEEQETFEKLKDLVLSRKIQSADDAESSSQESQDLSPDLESPRSESHHDTELEDKENQSHLINQPEEREIEEEKPVEIVQEEEKVEESLHEKQENLEALDHVDHDHPSMKKLENEGAAHLSMELSDSSRISLPNFSPVKSDGVPKKDYRSLIMSEMERKKKIKDNFVSVVNQAKEQKAAELPKDQSIHEENKSLLVEGDGEQHTEKHSHLEGSAGKGSIHGEQIDRPEHLIGSGDAYKYLFPSAARNQEQSGFSIERMDWGNVLGISEMNRMFVQPAPVMEDRKEEELNHSLDNKEAIRTREPWKPQEYTGEKGVPPKSEVLDKASVKSLEYQGFVPMSHQMLLTEDWGKQDNLLNNMDMEHIRTLKSSVGSVRTLNHEDSLMRAEKASNADLNDSRIRREEEEKEQQRLLEEQRALEEQKILKMLEGTQMIMRALERNEISRQVGDMRVGFSVLKEEYEEYLAYLRRREAVERVFGILEEEARRCISCGFDEIREYSQEVLVTSHAKEFREKMLAYNSLMALKDYAWRKKVQAANEAKAREHFRTLRLRRTVEYWKQYTSFCKEWVKNAIQEFKGLRMFRVFDAWKIWARNERIARKVEEMIYKRELETKRKVVKAWREETIKDLLVPYHQGVRNRKRRLMRKAWWVLRVYMRERKRKQKNNLKAYKHLMGVLSKKYFNALVPFYLKEQKRKVDVDEFEDYIPLRISIKDKVTKISSKDSELARLNSEKSVVIDVIKKKNK